MITITALALILLLLAGCAAEREPITPSADATARLAGVDWSRAERVDILLSEFEFAPNHLLFERGQPYRLHLENRGTGGHNFAAPLFFASVTLWEDPVAAEIRGNGGVELARGGVKDVYFVPLQAGTFPLECSHLLHPIFGMTGEIVVQ
jgi:uncharacterized cupredoxin-like copper-binding protein